MRLEAAWLQDPGDEEADAWASEKDDLEEAIGRLAAETLGDVGIKLTALCERLRQDVSPQYREEAATFMIAQCARDDLRRLAERKGAARASWNGTPPTSPSRASRRPASPPHASPARRSSSMTPEM